MRQRLREWLYDGADKAVPCRTEVAVERCFAPPLGGVVAWWRGASWRSPSTRPRTATG